MNEMKKTVLLLLVAATLTAGARAADLPAGKVDGKAAFARLKTLAGDWSGKGDGGMATPVSYKVSGNGSVVMETLFTGTPHEMITMYYLSGDDLVATHYCAGANQPHFKLDTAKSTPNELVLAFDGGTNLDAAKDSFMHGAKIAFLPDGAVDSQWETYDGGKPAGAHTFHLTRVGK
ncbi:MAG TPA: hypothetical protein VIE43_03530 [Thermoanaerobaculia bacterium]|nr:hypothetical protein [Thermoanaerobaculia bacterium]